MQCRPSSVREHAANSSCNRFDDLTEACSDVTGWNRNSVLVLSSLGCELLQSNANASAAAAVEEMEMEMEEEMEEEEEEGAGGGESCCRGRKSSLERIQYITAQQLRCSAFESPRPLHPRDRPLPSSPIAPYIAVIVLRETTKAQYGTAGLQLAELQQRAREVH